MGGLDFFYGALYVLAGNGCVVGSLVGYRNQRCYPSNHKSPFHENVAGLLFGALYNLNWASNEMATRFEADVDVPKPKSTIQKIQENQDIVRQFLTEGWASGDEDRFKEFLTTDHVQHGPATYQKFVGSDGTIEYMGRLWTAFPDLRINVTNIMGMGDQVLANGTIHGRHIGDLVMGDSVFEPTERGASWKVTAQCRIEDGKIAETYLGMTRADLMRQLGLRHPSKTPLVR